MSQAQVDSVFSIDGVGRLVRSVVPARGNPYVHRCELSVLQEVCYRFDEVPGGHTLDSMAAAVSMPSSQVAVALAFLLERGSVVKGERRMNYAKADDVLLDGMLEYHALREGAPGSQSPNQQTERA